MENIILDVISITREDYDSLKREIRRAKQMTEIVSSEAANKQKELDNFYTWLGQQSEWIRNDYRNFRMEKTGKKFDDIISPYIKKEEKKEETEE